MKKSGKNALLNSNVCEFFNSHRVSTKRFAASSCSTSIPKYEKCTKNDAHTVRCCRARFISCAYIDELSNSFNDEAKKKPSRQQLHMSERATERGNFQNAEKIGHNEQKETEKSLILFYLYIFTLHIFFSKTNLYFLRIAKKSV